MDTKTENPLTTAEPVAVQAPVEPDGAQRPARLALYLGIGLLAVGALALYLGYNGTATNALPQAQTPYLISGGLTGLALIALGGITLAVYVLLRVQADLRAEMESMRGAMEKMVGAIAGTAAFSAGQAASANGLVVVTKGTSSFHKPDCRLVTRSGSASTMTRADAGAAGLAACRICSP